MAQRWYAKASVQAAIVGGAFVLLTGALGPFVANRLWPPQGTSKSSGGSTSAAPLSIVPNSPPSSAEAGSASTKVAAPLIPKRSNTVKRSPKSPEVSINAPVQGSVIVSQGQTGGQVASTINNYGPPKRALSADMRGRMLRILQPGAPSCAAFASTQGDVEADEFKRLLMDVFRDAGWQVQDMSTFMFFGANRGLIVTIPVNSPETGSPQLVMQALAVTGNPLKGNRGDMAQGCGVYIQVWNAPEVPR